MTVGQLDHVLLIGALVLLVSVAAVRLSVGTGLPSLLLYVGLGLLIGEQGPISAFRIFFADQQLAQMLGYAALVVILAEGGLTTAWPTIRPVLPAAAVLATVGVGVSIAVTAAAAYLLVERDWRIAVLLGAVLAPTDAAAVFSVLRRVPLPRRLAGLLEAESGFNDAPVVILVVALSAPSVAGAAGASDPAGGGTLDAAVGGLALLLVYELALGAALGLAVGWVGAQATRRIALPASGLYPIAVLALAVLAYAAAAVLHASGFLAVYVAALVLGNAGLPHRPATRGFAEGLAWIAQIGLFVMLGLLATPSRLASAVLPALALGAALLLLARPLSVLVCLLPFRVGWREQVFLSWAGLRGAVPIVLATVPVVADPARNGWIFDSVFVLVVVFTLLQTPVLPELARRLRLVVPGASRDLDVETSPLGQLGADLLEVRVPAGSRLHGVEVFELRLPRGAAITLIVRDGSGFVPATSTALRAGDELLLVTTADARAGAEARLRAVSRGGRLAGWSGEDTRAPEAAPE